MRVGAYALERVLGRGAMGVVWSAVHVPTGAAVAVKVLLPYGKDAGKLRRGLERELEAIARLDSDHVLVVLDAGEIAASEATADLPAGAPYVVTELAEGDLARLRPAGWAGIREALADVLDGLAHAHARGVVHRDVKPENVFRIRGRYALGDFGIASVRGAGLDRAAGSPAYMAPEAMRAASVGPWTDLYALGCVAWELVAGLPPFGGDSVEEIVRAHLVGQLPPIAVDDGLARWLRTMLARDPAARFAFAADAREALFALGDVDLGEALERPAVTRTWSTWDAVTEVTAEIPPDEDAPRPTPATLPADWRGDRAPVSPMPRHGAAMALLGLRTPPMIGREAERDALWQALRDVAREGKARWVHVTGPALIGRTRLLEWLGERAHEVGGARVTWRVGPRRDALPSDPAALVADRPAVLLVDDADPEGVALVAALIRSRPVANHPVLAVTSSADEADADVLRPLTSLFTAAGDALVRVALGPLDVPGLEAIAQQSLRLAPELSAELARRAGGLPGFVVETVADWVRRGVLVSDGRRYTTADGQPAEIPESIARLGAARVARFEREQPGAVPILELLAAHGRRRPRASLVEDAARLGVAGPEAALDAALAAGLAAEDALGVGLVSPSVAAHVERESTEAGRWEAVHAAIADGLRAGHDPLALGRHLLAAGRPEEAIEPLSSAMRHHRNDYVRDEAVASTLERLALSRAGVPETDPRWARHHVLAGLSWWMRGDMAQARPHAVRGYELSRALGDVAGEIDAARVLAGIERVTGGTGLAWSEIAMRALAEHPESGSPVLRANVRIGWLNDLHHAGRHAEALRDADRWLAEVPPHHNAWPMLLRTRAHVLLTMGAAAEALADAERSYAGDVEHGRLGGQAFGSSCIGECAFDLGDAARAAASHERALALHRETGNLFGMRNELVALARARSVLKGELVGFDDARALTASLGLSEDEVLVYEAEAALAIGRGDEVREALRDVVSGRSAERSDLDPPLRALHAEAEAGWPRRWREAFDGLVRAVGGACVQATVTHSLLRSAARLDAAGAGSEADDARGLAVELAARAAALLAAR